MARFALSYQARLFCRLKIHPSVSCGCSRKTLSSVHTKTELEDYVVEFNEQQRFYEAKKISEMVRALFVLKLSSYDIFVKNSLSLMQFAEKFLGTRMFNNLMKRTIYSQFVAGEEYPDIKESIASLQRHGIGTILCVPTEEDFAEESDEFESKEPLFERNSEVIHDCIAKTETGALSQMRVSAICSPSLLKHLSDLLESYQSEIEKPNGLDVNNLAKGFDTDKYHNDLVPVLSESKNRHLQNSLRRLDSFAKHCKERNVKLLVDAEQSYIEGAIHQMILTLQSRHNTITPWVYGTYQCYRKDTLARLKADLNLMSNEGFHFGAKLVRGAYREQERQRSAELGFKDLIHDSYEDTCTSYNTVAEIILDKVACSPAEVMLATHNEESIRVATKRMHELGIDKRDKKVSFAQIYGMCDQVSYLLGSYVQCNKGYGVYKSVPYGPISTTLPYLVRRAMENRDITARTEKERSLMWKEIGYRLLPLKQQEYKYSQQEKQV
ncbi:hypothetical protein QZH41_019146 [Actinostola sp. cb2023]|nr:hypothetical protein QZH41_019146 [Actinostola sp. cb2023]